MDNEKSTVYSYSTHKNSLALYGSLGTSIAENVDPDINTIILV